MFGQGYTPEESAPQLPAGEYKARIKNVQVTEDEYARQTVYISLEYKDAQGRSYDGYKPDKIVFTDRPQFEQDVTEKQRMSGMTLADLQKNWDKRLTQFFDAFRIPRGNMYPEQWAGKVGYVQVRRQMRNGAPTGYMDIWPIVKQTGAAAKAPPPAPQAPAKTREQANAEAEAWRNNQAQNTYGTIPQIDDDDIPF